MPDDDTDARIRAAEADLAECEQADLANASNATLLLHIERLRSALADLIRMAHDCANRHR
jgi:hypothetical protein